MRNLRNIRHSWLEYPDSHLPLNATAWDADSDGLLCAFGPTPSQPVIELKRLDKGSHKADDGRLIASWDAPCPIPDIPCDRVLSLKYFAESQSVCLTLAGGDILVVREAPQDGEDLIEIVGSIDAGITAAAWSPDEELVAITTRADTFILMTRTFDSTANVQISPEDVKVSAHVSVGWGKRETQFQGKRAKALRDPTVPEHVDQGFPSPFDDGRTTISWRGDGAYLAVNAAGADGRRMIRVYSRDGELDSVSEPVDGLEGALSWRPSGNLLAGIRNRTGAVDVVFFERNGLRHGEFTLRLGDSGRPDWAGDISLAWNADSTALAVTFKDRLQLWTMGNYHYYLKQEIRHNPQETAIQTNWHPEKSLRLSAASNHSLDILAYYWNVSAGSVLAPADIGLAVVIDGASLKITPLALANVPPPMSLLELSLPANAIDACTNQSSDVVAVLYDDSIGIYRFKSTEDEVFAMESESIVRIEALPGSPRKNRQIAMNADEDIYVLTSGAELEHDTLLVFDSQGVPRFKQDLGGQAVSIKANLDYSQILCQVSKRSLPGTTITSKEATSPTSEQGLSTQLPIACPDISAWQAKDNRLIFGLSRNGTFYVYGKSATDLSLTQRLLVKGVTSYLITSAHLIFTTAQHLIKFVHLGPGDLQVPLDEPEKDERCRSIERGARLITAMPSSDSVVLQMPRGNLETIYPRALVLAGIRKAIMTKNFRRAFMACRNHRVDMNLLHDYAPSMFLANVDLFIDSVKKPAHIDLFLSSLREEDVAQTLYAETLVAEYRDDHGEEQKHDSGELAESTIASGSKVNRICDQFLRALEPRLGTHLQNIVTSHVCKNPPDLEAGLSLVSQLRGSDPARADQAVEHICFLADVNRLYDAALGLYDLDVALLVAQQSQKDPREYLPYLQNLQSLPTLRRQFELDNDLKRHAKALTHLHALDAFEELQSYTTKHALHPAAIELNKYNPPRLAALTRLYAQHLESNNQHTDAGIAYESLADYTAASDAYLAVQMWRESLTCAALAGRDAAAVAALAASLAEGLAEGKEHAAAAQVYGEYLGDAEMAARCWCRAYRFDEAMRVASRGAGDVLGVVDAGLGEGFATVTELLAEMKTQLGAQVPRLRELRVKKAEDPLAFYDGAGADANIPDDISLAPSNTTTSAGTFMTRYTARTAATLASNATHRTAKNRRREERKRARGKKGSVYEEEYLVASVGRLVERYGATVEDVRRLVVGLMRRGMRERAKAVEGLCAEVGELAGACLREVFEVGEDEAVGGEKRVVPVVKSLERLQLLGTPVH